MTGVTCRPGSIPDRDRPLAHAVLPACTFAEKDGTFTNLGRPGSTGPRGLDPIGESLPDWHIMTALANATGPSMGV